MRQLRSLLWSTVGGGGASIMVGAGMSRNAKALYPDRPPMPLWSDLTIAMAKEIWPSDLERRRRATDSLLVAEYYERLHRRTALEDLVQRHVRDHEFLPGRLHVLLLALPWTDVFTTNFDTLLERSTPQILERRYTVVVNEADLSSAQPPRIVKLHGSFPSHRPLILTQEDFRTYPKRFPAFVNTVQQSIMETAVCMIGFSGDDSNFQAWTGWVRDNLGNAAPPIYHCDVLDLDVARRSYYEARNIRPIDLGPLFPEAAYGKARRAAAIEWFILSLAEGAPIDERLWPRHQRQKPSLPLSEIVRLFVVQEPHRRSRNSDAPNSTAASDLGTAPQPPAAWEPTPGLPRLLEPDPGSEDRKAIEQEPAATLAEIRRLRNTYPSWLLLPSNFLFEHYFAGWYHALFPAHDSPEVLASLAWCFDLLRWPWPNNFLESVERTLAELSVPELVADMLDLLRFLIREVRERDEEERFHRWMDKFRQASGSSPIVVAEWWLEKARFHLSRLELREAEAALKALPTHNERPFLEIIRGALFYELGRFESAATLAASGVDDLRRHSSRHTPHLRLIGQEASGLDLAFAAVGAFQLDAFMASGTGFARREELLRTGADPRQCLELLGIEISKEARPTQSIKKEFDPGTYTKTISHSYGNQGLQPYQYLRGLEVSAQLPTTHKEHVSTAAKAISLERPGQAFSHLVRCHGSLDDTFSRDALLRLKPESAITLQRRCISFLRAINDADWNEFDADRHGLHFRASEISLEMLSRLTVCSTPEMRSECLTLALALHDSLELRKHWTLYRKIPKLFQRLFLAMSFDEQRRTIPRLLGLRIPNIKYDEPLAQEWRDPSAFIAEQHAPVSAAEAMGLERPITKLVEGLRNADRFARSVITSRLCALRRTGVLSAQSRIAFSVALWATASKESIPDVDGFSYSLGLVISEGQPDAKQRFASWALAARLPPLSRTRVGQGGVVARDYLGHWVDRHISGLEAATALPWSRDKERGQLIAWTSKEAGELLGVVEEWLVGMVQSGAKVSEREAEDIDCVVHFIAVGIIPRLELADTSMRNRIVAAEATLAQLVKHSLERHPTWLLVDPTSNPEPYLQELVISHDAVRVRAGLERIVEWALFAQAGTLRDPSETILDQLFFLASSTNSMVQTLALSDARTLYIRRAEILTTSRRRWLQLAFERILGGPKLADNDADDTAKVPTGDVRASAARLLTTLALREPNDATWQRLVAVARADRYPEVRQACEEAQHEDVFPGAAV